MTQPTQPTNLHEQQCRRLLEQMPWLAAYDHEFLMQFVRAGVRRPQDLWKLYSPSSASNSAHRQESDAQPLGQAKPQSPAQASPATTPPEMLHDYPLEFVLEQIGDTNTCLLNILRRNGINTVGQLLQLDEGKLWQTRHCGARTVGEICGLQQQIMSDLRNPERCEKLRAAHAQVHKDADEQLPSASVAALDVAPSDVDEVRQYSVDSLAELLERLLESLLSHIGQAAHAQRDADIWRWRHGLTESGASTLQEIAEYHDLSRERIRQIADRSVHSCLTLYDEFVPTDERGMYGLTAIPISHITDRFVEHYRHRAAEHLPVEQIGGLTCQCRVRSIV